MDHAMADGLSNLYQDLLSGSYDCVDRIVLNGYFGMGHSPGGFRVWWRDPRRQGAAEIPPTKHAGGAMGSRGRETYV